MILKKKFTAVHTCRYVYIALVQILVLLFTNLDQDNVYMCMCNSEYFFPYISFLHCSGPNFNPLIHQFDHDNVYMCMGNSEYFFPYHLYIVLVRVRRNRWPVASIFTVGPVKQNKDRPAGPIDILGPLGPATFTSSNR